MAEHQENTSLSAEVVGNFSQAQKEEFAFLSGQILEAQGGDLQKREDIEKAAFVAGDCVKRGLRVLGKVWFQNPDESIARAFDTGLSERERVVNTLSELARSERSHRFLSSEEDLKIIDFVNTNNPLSLDLESGEDLLNQVSERSRNITRFHRFLFTDSSLAPQANLLKKAAFQREVASVERITGEDVIDGIYRNLLVHLILYPGSSQPDLLIEPQDIAAVVDLWKVPAVRQAGNDRLIEGMKALAKRFGVSEEAVAIYTDRMLDDFTLVMQGVDADTLKSLTTFIITDESLAKEGVQPEVAENIIIPQQQTQQAEEKINQFIALEKRIEEALDKSDKYDDHDELMDQLGKEQIEVIRSLSTYELLHILRLVIAEDNRINVILKRDILEEVPSGTYIGVLPLVYQKVTGINDQMMEKLRKVVEDRVLNDINNNKVDDLDKKLLSLPAQFLILTLERGFLNQDQQQNLSNQDAPFWIILCLTAGVSFQSTGEDLTFGNLRFPSSTNALERYIEQMSKDKQTEIIKGIRQEITF